ncbi:hypothetical protein GCM10028818_00230 [Spirosoma horti]
MNLSFTSNLQKQRRYPVLVVENDVDQWLTLSSAFAQCFPEIEPIWIEEPSQALAYLRSRSRSPLTIPRLIFMNSFLPSQEEGWVFLKQLKSDPCFKQIPVIVLSHTEVPEDVIKAYTQGAAMYITKSSNRTQLLLDFYTLKKYWWQIIKMSIVL